MGVLDGPLRGVAKQLIGKFGVAATHTSIATGSYNPTTGTAGTTPTTQTLTGVVSEFKAAELGGNIKAGDLKFEVAAKGVTAPAVQDTVTLDSKVYQVANIASTWSGEQVATYTLALRR